MLPEPLLRFSRAQGKIIPHYLDQRDYPWLHKLVDEYQKFVDRPHCELAQHLKGPLPFLAPSSKKGLASLVLNRIFRSEIESPVPPKKLRSLVFEKAVSERDREHVLSMVAEKFGIRAREVESSLFSDLPSERRIVAPKEPISIPEVALRANHLLAQGFLARSLSVQITFEGQARRVVRQAKLRGLICQVRAAEPDCEMVLTVSGPFSLFRKTLLYGRALGELLPLLAWCHRFHLRAKCVIGEIEQEVMIVSGDPIFPAKAPKEFDSQVEERFAKRFAKLAPDWDLIREPEPVEAEGTLIFPDFIMRNRHNTAECWWLEILGFWTPSYLVRKLERLRRAGLDRLILCISESLSCGQDELPSGALIVRYRKQIDPLEVLKLIDPVNSKPLFGL